ncbi:hypothetical protein ACFYRI_20325 [Streptomyces microflavus]|uniref:hypothetical protein n=1 Tax=Streptomyces microflavus TaxID=1919 RepID=UPI00368D1724
MGRGFGRFLSSAKSVLKWMRNHFRVFPLIRTAGAVALVGAALLPGLIAALPLVFNGAQHTLSALGRATMPEGATASRGWASPC